MQSAVLCELADRQTDGQTNARYHITSFAKVTYSLHIRWIESGLWQNTRRIKIELL